MPNCATHLAELLHTFQVQPGQRPEIARGFADHNDLSAWRRHAIAADLIKSVDYTLQGINDGLFGVDMYLAALPRWYAGVHFATTPWGTMSDGGAPRAACSEGDLNLLEALGRMIMMMTPHELDEGDREQLLASIARARELVEADPTMPADLKVYLLGLIIRAEQVIRDLDQHGAESARQVSLELGGALFSRATVVEHAGNTGWAERARAVAQMLVSGFVGTFGQDAAVAVRQGVTAAVKQLGGS